MLSAKGFACWGWPVLPAAGAASAFLCWWYSQPRSHAGDGLAVILVGLFARQELMTSVQSLAMTLLGMFYVGWHCFVMYYSYAC